MQKNLIHKNLYISTNQMLEQIKKIENFRINKTDSFYLDLDEYILNNLNTELYFVDLIKVIKKFSKKWDIINNKFSFTERKCTIDSLDYIFKKMNYKFKKTLKISKNGNSIPYYSFFGIKKLNKSNVYSR